MNELISRHQLNLRFASAEDVASVKKLAAKNHMTTSAFLRWVAHTHANKENVMIDIAPLENIQLELRREGNNLNQLAHFMNTHSRTCDKLDLEMIKEAQLNHSQVLGRVLDALDALDAEAEKYNITLFDSRENEEEQNED